MEALILWLQRPLSEKHPFFGLFWSAFLVFGIWMFYPICYGKINWVFLSLEINPHNIILVMNQSFGEELFFRVLPIFLVLKYLSSRISIAILFALVVDAYFGLWHDQYTAYSQAFLAVGGVILSIVYLKYGGARDKPFQGLLACGSIHSFCNLMVMFIANVMILPS